MQNELDPRVGQWYLHRDKGEMFRVVALDSSTDGIETQRYDGDLEELDSDAWREMDIEATAAPEDWTGPFDDVAPGDRGETETPMSLHDWRVALEWLPV